MKPVKVLVILSLSVICASMLAFTFGDAKKQKKKKAFVPPAGCVFRTVMGEESSSHHSIYKTPEKVNASLERGLSFIVKGQQADGGWGAGSHDHQDERNPHAVMTDPATTAMVAMALLRNGHSLYEGQFQDHVRKALNYILNAVENAAPQSNNITTLTGTQIQTKLGANIDVILASQLLSNVQDHLREDDQLLSARIRKCQDICVRKIQQAQSDDGSIAGPGWAGVLQSSFATNALEAAEAQGASVDKQALAKARDFQKGNYDAKTGAANTEMGAGIVLYSVTSSARASAKEARRVEEVVTKAKAEGKIAQAAPASAETLKKLGYDEDDAIKYATAYEVYQSAKVQSQREDVMDGFGNNGGEEFLSYLQTGESMIINKDNTWQDWYDNMSGRLLKIQNENGSWNGHHCITSPIFCTATCLLILSVQNDVDKLMKLGEVK